MSVRLERLIRIYNRLRRGPVTIDIISKWAKGAGIVVSDRQLYRDLNALKSLRISEKENVLEFADEKNRKTWKLEYEEPGEKLSQYDINSFFLIKNFAPHSIITERSASIEKIERIVYQSRSRSKYQQLIEANELYLRRTNFSEAIHLAPEQKKIEDLLWALHHKRLVVVQQDVLNTANLHRPKFPVTMVPLELVFHRGRVHVAGVDKESGCFLLFTIDGGLRFELTNIVFNRKKYTAAYHKDFDLLFGISEPKQRKVYRIRLEFTGSNADACRNYFWHHTQRWEPLKNGNAMLHLHCSIGRELAGFVLAGVDKVKVHSPKVLRDLVVQKLRQNLELYEKGLRVDEERANADY